MFSFGLFTTLPQRSVCVNFPACRSSVGKQGRPRRPAWFCFVSIPLTRPWTGSPSARAYYVSGCRPTAVNPLPGRRGVTAGLPTARRSPRERRGERFLFPRAQRSNYKPIEIPCFHKTKTILSGTAMGGSIARGSREMTRRWRKPDSNHRSRKGAGVRVLPVLVHADFSAGADQRT